MTIFRVFRSPGHPATAPSRSATSARSRAAIRPRVAPAGRVRPTKRDAPAIEGGSPEVPVAPLPLLVLHVAGSQVEMGRQHAELLRQAGGFEAAAGYYPHLAARMLASGAHTAAERAALRALRPALDAAVRRLDADRPEPLRERSRAFFEALGEAPGLGRYVSIMDVFQNAVGLLGRIGVVPLVARLGGAPGCSTLVAWGDRTEDGSLLHARNFDFPGVGVWDAAPAVVFCTPDDGLRYGFLTMRGADVPGVSAFNEAGICVTAHTRLHRDVAFRGASIVDIGHEVARRATSLAEAIAIASERPCASTWGLAISSSRERAGAVVELTAAGARATVARAGESFVATSNLYQHRALQPGEIAPSPAWIHDCAGRATALRRRAARGALDVGALWAMLGDHEDPDVPGHERAGGACLAAPYTVQSLVADLARGVVHASVGPSPTGRGPFATVPVTWDAPIGASEATAITEPVATSRYHRDAAHARYVQAVRLEQMAAPQAEIRAALEGAVSGDPTDASYRFLAGCAALGAGDAPTAREHLSRALEQEPNTFRRGQIRLWAARAADIAGDGPDAGEHRARLAALRHPHLGPVQAEARSERPFTAAKARRIAVHPALVHASA
jgi:hypothetical protein